MVMCVSWLMGVGVVKLTQQAYLLDMLAESLYD